jgi:deazaflavin-dependent oxidoreductase (nitroreductase family)
MGLLNTELAKRALNAPRVIALLKATVPPTDKFLMRCSRGWVNTAMQSIVLMETRGAKSGQAREIATLCMPMGDDLLLVGSNWGGEKDPAWVHNLRAQPRATIIYRGYKGPVSAVELAEAERPGVWPKLVAFNPQYAHYQTMTKRPLPIVRLTKTI